mgnify:CR=1 FL=1
MTTEPKIAQTWEECARHVEAGGVVQRYCDDMWMDESLPVTAYRGTTGTPGGDWCHPRRLLPIAAPATPEGMSPGPVVDGRPTWYGTGGDAQVAGMTEARVWTNGKWSFVGLWPAASIVQARYPLPPKPKTERVHWWEAAGREDPNDGVIKWVTKVVGSEPRVYFAGCGWTEVSSPDGTVEVLAEDGES